MGRRRVPPQRLRWLRGDDQGRVRAPHHRRIRLHQRRGARPDPVDLRLPHPDARLVGHRLQLPRRPLRTPVRRPLERHGPAGDRRPHRRLQHQHRRGGRPGRPRDKHGPGRCHDRLRAAPGLEARPARSRPLGPRHPHLGRWRRQPLPGRPGGRVQRHLRPPRRQLHPVPRPVSVSAAVRDSVGGRRRHRPARPPAGRDAIAGTRHPHRARGPRRRNPGWLVTQPSGRRSRRRPRRRGRDRGPQPHRGQAQPGRLPHRLPCGQRAPNDLQPQLPCGTAGGRQPGPRRRWQRRSGGNLRRRCRRPRRSRRLWLDQQHRRRRGTW